MKKYLITAAFAFCFAFWAWIGWFYLLPISGFALDLLVQRQGPWLAAVSASVALTVILWGYYAACANIDRAIRDKTAPVLMQVLGYLFLLPPMLTLDWGLNWTVFAVLFGQWPAHAWELITGRLDRYSSLAEYQGTKRWRGARIFALILDALDWRGYHIKKFQQGST